MRYTMTIYRDGNAYTYRSSNLSMLMALLEPGAEYVITDHEELTKVGTAQPLF